MHAIINFATKFFEMFTKKQSRHPHQVSQVFHVFRVFQVFHVRFWTTKPPDFGPNRNKTGVSSVSSVPHQRGPLTKREARLTKRACERLTKCEARLTHKKGVSSVPHPYSLPFREGQGVGFSFSLPFREGSGGRLPSKAVNETFFLRTFAEISQINSYLCKINTNTKKQIFKR